MRQIGGPNVDYPMVVEDLSGRGFQYMPETVVRRYDHIRRVEWDHTIEGGWWDLSMTNKIDPKTIQFPAMVVWERNEREQ